MLKSATKLGGNLKAVYNRYNLALWYLHLIFGLVFIFTSFMGSVLVVDFLN